MLPVCASIDGVNTAVPVKVPVTDTAIPVAYVTPAVEDIVPLISIEVTLSGEFSIIVL